MWCTILQLFAAMSPERAAFSLAARSAVHMFLGGNAVGAAVGCAFLVFSRHWRFMFGKMVVQPTYRKLFYLCGL
jgi:hypothetical protein